MVHVSLQLCAFVQRDSQRNICHPVCTSEILLHCDHERRLITKVCKALLRHFLVCLGQEKLLEYIFLVLDPQEGLEALQQKLHVRDIRLKLRLHLSVSLEVHFSDLFDRFLVPLVVNLFCKRTVFDFHNLLDFQRDVHGVGVHRLVFC